MSSGNSAFKREKEPIRKIAEIAVIVPTREKGGMHLPSETFERMGRCHRQPAGTGFAKDVYSAELDLYAAEGARRTSYRRTEDHDSATYFLDIVKKLQKV